jgi:hypothetical protein
VLNLTQTAGDTLVAITHDPGDLLVIGTPGYYGTSGASSDELEKGWWIVCKEATDSDEGAWVPAHWDVIEMDYSTGLQQQLIGRRDVIEPEVSANTGVAIAAAFNHVPFDVRAVHCFVNGIALNYNATDNINTLPVNNFGISGQNLWIHLPYDLNADAADDDLVTLVYFSV